MANPLSQTLTYFSTRPSANEEILNPYLSCVLSFDRSFDEDESHLQYDLRKQADSNRTKRSHISEDFNYKDTHFSSEFKFYFGLLAPWDKVFLEQVTICQAVKKFPGFYGSRRFVTVFKTAHHLSLFPQSAPNTPSKFTIHFNINVPSMRRSY
jgi:hypothetical protein